MGSVLTSHTERTEPVCGADLGMSLMLCWYGRPDFHSGFRGFDSRRRYERPGQRRLVLAAAARAAMCRHASLAQWQRTRLVSGWFPVQIRGGARYGYCCEATASVQDAQLDWPSSGFTHRRLQVRALPRPLRHPVHHHAVNVVVIVRAVLAHGSKARAPPTMGLYAAEVGNPKAYRRQHRGAAGAMRQTVPPG